MKKEVFRKLLASSVLACAASVVQAQPIDNWNFEIVMSWTDAVFEKGASSDHTLAGTKVTDTVLSWGYDGARDAYPDSFLWSASTPAYYTRSSLVITEPKVSGSITTNSANATPVNIFQHTNNPIYFESTSLDYATLSLTVKLGTSDIPALYSFTQDFQVFFVETPNTGGTCGWGPCDDDIFAILAVAPQLDDFTRTFGFGGYDYTINYFETTAYLNALSEAACKEAGVPGGSACYGFTTPERDITQVKFAFSITAVPEPDTYAMLLAGLGLVGVMVRRRRDMPRK
jgi:hypothetical protein